MRQPILPNMKIKRTSFSMCSLILDPWLLAIPEIFIVAKFRFKQQNCFRINIQHLVCYTIDDRIGNTHLNKYILLAILDTACPSSDLYPSAILADIFC